MNIIRRPRYPARVCAIGESCRSESSCVWVRKRLGARLEPQLAAAQIKAAACGKVERSVAAEVLDFDVGTRVQKRNSDIGVTAKGCAHERRAAAIIPRVDAGA